MYVVYFIFYIRRIKLFILAMKLEIQMNVPTVMTHLPSYKCITKLQSNKELGQTCHSVKKHDSKKGSD